MAEPPTLPMTSSTAAQVSAGGPPEPPKGPDVGEVLFGRRENRGPTVRSILRVDRHRRAARARALRRLPAADADLLPVDGRLPRRRAVGAGRRSSATTCRRALAIDDRLLRPDRDPDRDRRDPDPAARPGGRRPRQRLPGYVDDLQETVSENETLQDLNENFDLTSKLEDLADDARRRARRRRRRARRHRRRPRRLDLRPVHDPHHEPVHGRPRRRLDRRACSSYAPSRTRPQAIAAGARPHGRSPSAPTSAAALLQATIAGVAAFIVLSILGVPSPLALAVMIAMLDLIPLVGATLGAILVGDRHPVHRLPDRDDHLGDLRDRLPAVRELRDPAADPEPRRRSSTRSSSSSRRSSAARCSASSARCSRSRSPPPLQIGVREFIALPPRLASRRASRARR